MSEPLHRYVTRRRSEWDQLERVLDGVSRRRGQVAIAELHLALALSRAVAADLAVCQQRYPGSSVENHVAGLVAAADRMLQGSTPHRPWKNILGFVRSVWPALVWKHRGVVGLSAAVIVSGVVLGLLVTWTDVSMGEALAGPGIAASIERGDVWTDPVEEQGQHAAMSAFIFTNNIRVSLAAFALGLAFGLGALLLLLFNGLHLGAVVALTGQDPAVQRGLLDFIAAHGPVELSLIAIAGGAGMWLGSALIDPGQRPRSEVLRERGREAVLLVVGCAPWFVAIGLVEGFVSPGHLVPTPLKVALGLGALVALGWWIRSTGLAAAVDDPARGARNEL
ncbi:MAG: stage II sporulation protein M [Pseudomonadota bacterium]